jgi:hypothetical protein
MSFESDESVAAELAIYLDNERTLYKQKQEIAKNLVRKIKAGTYNHKLAPKLWGYVVERAAKMYDKEFGTGRPRAWADMFPPKIRLMVAKELADRWYANAKAGRPDEV